MTAYLLLFDTLKYSLHFYRRGGKTVSEIPYVWSSLIIFKEAVNIPKNLSAPLAKNTENVKTLIVKWEYF